MELKLYERSSGRMSTKPGHRFIKGRNSRKPKPEPQLCECGCGNYAKPGNRFITGHNSKKPKRLIPEPQLCECGCGEFTKPGNRFIMGHNLRTERYWELQQEPQLCECGCGGYAKPGRRFIVGHVQKGRKYKLEPEPQLCECGCGGYVAPGSRFINGHQNRTKVYWKRQQEPKLCACGCGDYAEPGNDYIHGHHSCGDNNPMKNPETVRKSSIARTGGKRTDKTKSRLSVAGIKRFKNPVEREKLSAGHQGIPYEEWEKFACESLYCPDFNEECKESNREKYDRMCFLTGLPEEENITSTGKQKKLTVHHVDMDKGQGCDGIKWKLVPLCMEWHTKVHNELWEARIIWLLDNVWNKP